MAGNLRESAGCGTRTAAAPGFVFTIEVRPASIAGLPENAAHAPPGRQGMLRLRHPDPFDYR